MQRTSKINQYLLDTHIFLWLILGSKNLRERRALETAAAFGGLLISTITCWEIGMLTSRGRLNFGMSCQDWIEQALKAPGLKTLDISPRIAVEASYLPGKFQGDPADKILIATARVKNIILATRDKQIWQYSEKGFVNVLPC